eukprot:6346728-Pyramimonas_sp.AAC.1
MPQHYSRGPSATDQADFCALAILSRARTPFWEFSTASALNCYIIIIWSLSKTPSLVCRPWGSENSWQRLDKNACARREGESRPQP